MTTHGNEEFISKLRQFYESTLAQNKISFWASTIASGAGLLCVILAFIAYFYNPNNIDKAVVLGIAGVLSQFIAAAFFYIRDKSLVQTSIGFEKLVKLQDTNLAVELVSRMDQRNRDYMYMSIINVLILRNEPNREISADVVRALKETGKPA